MTTAFNKLHGAPRATDTDEAARAMELRKAALGAEFSHASYGNMPNTPAARDIAKRADFLSTAASAAHRDGAGHPVDAGRRRELHEVELHLGGKAVRVRLAIEADHLNIHGVKIALTDIPDLLRSQLLAGAAALGALQGRQEQAAQIELVGALVDRVLARDKFAGDAVTRQLDHERYHAV